MDEETRILATSPKTQAASSSRDACLVHIYPTGPDMGSRYPLTTEKALVLGRDDDCDIRIQDESVSRHHACIQHNPEGYCVLDLRSTNGTYVNDALVTMCPLKDGDYLRIGNGIFRFLYGSNVEAEYHEEIYRLTIVDGLTEVYNKRYLLEALARSLSLATRYRRPLALIMFDIDHFKAINDQYGHLCGDFALRELTTLVKHFIRKDDLFARYGGEEFAIILPETNQQGAQAMAENLRRLVAAAPFDFEGQRFSVTISIGVTAIDGEQWVTTSEMIDQADRHLYEAKHQGRNRVVS